MPGTMTNIVLDIEQKATKIAFYDPYGIFEDVKEDLEARLPLVNLHWKPPNRPLRSIPSLEIELVEEEAQVEVTQQHQMLGLSQDPYLKIVFVKCDDIDTYRHSVRKLIREWLSSNVVGLRDPTEWLIVHYVPKGSKNYTGNRFRSGVFDKIKADFNSGSKKDRCLQIRYGMSSEIEAIELWSEITTKIKEGVLEAFGRRAQLYQEEISKLEAKKNVLGWNFGNFFVMKEGLALSFENMNLFEDALLLYDDLELAFNQFSAKSMPFLTSVGFENAPVPVSLLTLYDDVPKLRRAILQSEISLFDFRCYLFSRQALLLLHISNSSSSVSISALRIGELYSRLKVFITDMKSLLTANKKNPLMIAEWSYNVVREFYKAAESLQDGVSLLVSEGRGELLLLCRHSLERLASTKGWIVKGTVSDVALEEEKSIESHDVENTELKEALKDETSFHAKYRELTLAASAEFDLADRVRTVNMLTCELAMLEYNLGNFQTAEELLEGIPTLYSRQGWNLLSTYLLSIYVESLQKVGRNSEKILMYSVELLKRHKYLDKAQILLAAKNVQDLSITYQFQTQLEDCFKIDIDLNTAGKDGLFEITIQTRNLIGVPFEFDRGVMILANQNGETLEYRCSKFTVSETAVTNLVFKSETFIEGNFQVQHLMYFRGNLIFKADFSTSDLIISHYQQPGSIWGFLRVAPRFTLTDRQIALELHCPSPVQELEVTFKSEPGVRFATQRASIDRGTLRASEVGKVIIQQVRSGESLMIVPYVAAYDKKALPITVSMKASSSSREIFSHNFSQTVDVGLAIDVAVQDYFKAKLYCRFSVAANKSPVRIHRVQSLSSGFTLNSPVGIDRPAIAFPGNPINYVFSIEEKVPNLDNFELRIKHGYLRHEISDILFASLDKVLLSDNPLYKYKILIRDILRVVDMDIQKYALEKELVPLTELQEIAQRFPIVKDREKVLAFLQQLLKGPFDFNKPMPACELVLTVPVPRVNCVVQVETLFPDEPVVVGTSVPLTFRIHKSTKWATKDIDKKDIDFTYEVSTNQSWILSGKKKSTFTQDIEFKVFAIPLQTGKLRPPKLDLSTVSSIKMEIGYRYSHDFISVVSHAAVFL